MKTLREALEEANRNPPADVEFRPCHFYSEVGNILNVYGKDSEEFYSEQIDPILTLHRDKETKAIVGYTLWLDSIEAAKEAQ